VSLPPFFFPSCIYPIFLSPPFMARRGICRTPFGPPFCLLWFPSPFPPPLDLTGHGLCRAKCPTDFFSCVKRILPPTSRTVASSPVPFPLAAMISSMRVFFLRRPEGPFFFFCSCSFSLCSRAATQGTLRPSATRRPMPPFPWQTSHRRRASLPVLLFFSLWCRCPLPRRSAPSP